MKIAIAGGTGFLGVPLVGALVARHHQVVVLTRRPADSPPWGFGHGDPSLVRVAAWNPEEPAGEWASNVQSVDVVCNLAGLSIGDGRWTDARKTRIRESRLTATRSLVAAVSAASVPPRTFVSASGVGYYGPRADEELTEDSPAGGADDFLASVCVEWEAAAQEAAAHARVVILRTGVVLDADGGALPRMARAFRFLAGGRLGSGRQFLSWIHRDDWVRLVVWAIDHPSVSGPVNVTAPAPVTNREFTRTLARALGRPALLPAPAFALRLALGGERAAGLLLASQRAVPARALASGFEFRYPDLAGALRAIYG